MRMHVHIHTSIRLLKSVISIRSQRIVANNIHEKKKKIIINVNTIINV